MRQTNTEQRERITHGNVQREADGGKPRALLNAADKALRVCAAALAVILAAGTVYGALKQRTAQSTAQSATVRSAESAPDGNRAPQMFTGLGTIRASTADPEPAAVILSVSFPYDPADRAFLEELTLRLAVLREAAAAYIASCTADDLQTREEEAVKAELVRRLNANLRLGKITQAYFTDFLVVR
jgi:flagellar basal body-associated protein FliL